MQVTLQRSRFSSTMGIQVNVLTVNPNTADLFKAPTAQWLGGIYLCVSVQKVFIVMETCGGKDL